MGELAVLRKKSVPIVLTPFYMSDIYGACMEGCCMIPATYIILSNPNLIQLQLAHISRKLSMLKDRAILPNFMKLNFEACGKMYRTFEMVVFELLIDIKRYIISWKILTIRPSLYITSIMVTLGVDLDCF